MGDIEAAIEALKLLGIGEKLNVTNDATQYVLDYTTLSIIYQGYPVQGINIRVKLAVAIDNSQHW